MTAPSHIKGVRRMEKMIAAITLLMLLSSCSNVSNEPDASRAVTVTEEAATTTEATTTEPITAEQTTEAEIPPATEPTEPTEPEVNELLFDSDGLKLFYQGVDQNFVKIGVENYSTTAPCAIHIFMNNIFVNGEKIVNENGIESYIEPQTTETLYYNLPLDELQSRDITRINELSFDFWMQAGDWSLQTESFTVTR